MNTVRIVTGVAVGNHYCFP